LDHTDKQVIRVAGVRTQMRFPKRLSGAVDTEQPILANLNGRMVRPQDGQKKACNQQGTQLSVRDSHG